MGCGAVLMYSADEASGFLKKALDRHHLRRYGGGYGNGESERRVGLVMKTRRNDVRLATKIPESLAIGMAPFASSRPV